MTKSTKTRIENYVFDTRRRWNYGASYTSQIVSIISITIGVNNFFGGILFFTASCLFNITFGYIAEKRGTQKREAERNDRFTLDITGKISNDVSLQRLQQNASQRKIHK